MTATPEQRIELIGRASGASASSAGARERILGEATRLFYDRGIRAAGVDLVIAEAGVAKASFYRHFPSKSLLVVAYLDRRENAWRAWLEEEAAARARTPQRRLLAVFDAIGEQIADPHFRGSAIANAVAEVGEEIPEVVERAKHHRCLLLDLLASLAKDAGCRRPRDVAEECVLLVDGLLSASRFADDGARPATAAAKRSVGRLIAAQTS